VNAHELLRREIEQSGNLIYTPLLTVEQAQELVDEHRELCDQLNLHDAQIAKQSAVIGELYDAVMALIEAGTPVADWTASLEQAEQFAEVVGKATRIYKKS
jgi:hypothetical protein